MEKSGLRFEVIRSAKRFSALDTRALLSHINSLVSEKSRILIDRQFTLKQEKAWQAERARGLQSGEFLPIICWDKENIAGITEARRGAFKERHNVSIGIALGKSYRGKGIGKKLLKLAISEAKKTMKAKNIWLEYEEGNTPAKRLYWKMGFVECARLPGFIKHYGRYCDKVFMKYSK
ncbi:MAG: GNAT family N-acetyltransferase [Candidatus Micrarchaeia archaeon]